MTQNDLILEMFCLMWGRNCASDIFQAETEKRREEQRKFGVFYDDDYDYLQHLKEASGPSELVEAGPSYTDKQAVHILDEEEDEEEQERDETIPVSWLG